MRGIAVRHPVTAYFVLAFAGAWLFMAPLVLSVDGLAWLRFKPPPALQMTLFILATFAGPTLAAYLVTGALEGKAGIVRFVRRYGQWRVGAVPWLVGLFGYPLVLLLAGTIVFGTAALQGLLANPMTFFTVYLPAVFIFPAFITWGEEPGWRGFALTRMQMAYHPLVATLVVGFMHALWHLPAYFLTDGPNALGPFNLGAVAINTFMIMIMTIIWTWAFNRAKGSILIAVVLHASTNATMPWINSFAPELAGNQTVVMLATAMIVAATLAVIVFTRGRLGYGPAAKG